MQWIWSNTLNYSLDFGKNSLVALAGMEAKKEYGEHVQGYGQGLVIDDLDYRYLDVVTSAKNVGNNSSTYAMISYFGKGELCLGQQVSDFRNAASGCFFTLRTEQ